MESCARLDHLHDESDPQRRRLIALGLLTKQLAPHGIDLLFEAPAPAGLPGEDAPRTEVEVDGLRVVIIGIEDLLIDRLRAWVRWNSDEDGRWVRRLALLYPDRIDWHYVRERTSKIPEEAEALSKVEREACPNPSSFTVSPRPRALKTSSGDRAAVPPS